MELVSNLRTYRAKKKLQALYDLSLTTISLQPIWKTFICGVFFKKCVRYIENLYVNAQCCVYLRYD
jgi:hypothetical protein